MAVTVADVKNWVEIDAFIARSLLGQIERLLRLWLEAKVEGIDLSAAQQEALKTQYQAARSSLASALQKLP